MNSFYNLASECGTDKVLHHGYHFFYPRFLECMREDCFRMLEIGYGDGASARFWEKYFPIAEVFVMDIGISGLHSRHEVLMGDQSKHDDLVRIVERVGSARFIIDDGSHQPSHQYETFEYLFENLLEPGGVYIIEDVECNYWRSDAEVYGYKIGNFNAIKKSTELIDSINSEFSGMTNRLNIGSVTYGQNCIIITKRTQEEISYFDRPYRFSNFVNVKDPLNNDVSNLSNKYIKNLIGTITRTFFEENQNPKWVQMNEIYASCKEYFSSSIARFEGSECWPFEADSMIGVYRMVNIYESIKDVCERRIDGDFVETGVWKGGACVLANAVIHELQQQNHRRVHVFDSFEGLPMPYMEQDSGDIHHTFDFLSVNLDYVKGVFSKYGYLTDNVVFRKGFFSETMKNTSDISKIAVLRLDGDMYSSTIEVLEALYDKVSDGGLIIVDDWTLPGAYNAVNDFLSSRGEQVQFFSIDNSSCYWRK
jgi:hypothetical protein